MDIVKDFVQDYWYVALGLAGLVLILLVVVFVCLANAAKYKRALKSSAQSNTALAGASGAPAEQSVCNEQDKEALESMRSQLDYNAATIEAQQNSIDKNQETIAQQEKTIKNNQETLARQQEQINQNQQSAAKSEPKQAAKAEPKQTAKTEPKQTAKAEPKQTAKSEPKQATKAESATKASAAAPERESAAAFEPIDEDDEEVIEVEGMDAEVQAKTSMGYIINFDRAKNNWIIRKKGEERATRRAATKEEAVKIGKELSRKYNVPLTIQKKDGRFQKQR